MSCDLHRHDHFSLFDGSGSTMEMAQLAKAKGYTALGTSNHGSTSGLVEHYFSCKEVGIKPILGVEAYFQPKFDKEKPSYHLCIFAKDLKGYENMNNIVTAANKEQFYRHPIVDFSLLKQYSEGLICTSACIGGLIPKAISEDNKELAIKAAKKFKAIFGEDFYIEIQPYKLSQEGLQERVNESLIKLANKLGIRCILTSDSHYGEKESFDTYLKMHEMNGTRYDVGETYGERYMPDLWDLEKRFTKMHGNKNIALKMHDNLEELEAKIVDDIFEDLQVELPVVCENSEQTLKENIVKGLKRRGKYNKIYLDRCKYEYDVITHLGFQDYFLIVEDYVRWAKDHGIEVGPGRGSVCNCAVAYALGIIDVDPVYFDLDFDRFLRKDKKKLPDIDLDFDERRDEVIEYLLAKYPGKAVRISSYGLYKIDNLVNDLCKVCEVDDDGKRMIKSCINSNSSGEGNSKEIHFDKLKKSPLYASLNKEYDNILLHFTRLYGKIRYLGTHSAGVAICGNNINKYTAIRRYKDAFVSAYDHNNIERINAVKFDMLGLTTCSIIKELKQLTGRSFDDSWMEDGEVFHNYCIGNTTGIFQFESPVVRKMLENMEADCMNDIVAANALNRPGPLQMKMPDQYAANKHEFKQGHIVKNRYYEYTKKTYGTIVYQEQVMKICMGIGKMTYSDADLVVKFMKSLTLSANVRAEYDKESARLEGIFVKGAVENGLSEHEARDIFDKMKVYTFNEGHATGYAVVSIQEMWYKVNYPLEFWCTKLKYVPLEEDFIKFKMQAVQDGQVILLPHVNGTSEFSIKEIDGDKCLQEGLINIKNVGPTAAAVIEAERKKNGRFKSYDDFVERVPKRQVNSKVVSALVENGALEFNKKIYFGRVKKYNSALYTRGSK